MLRVYQVFAPVLSVFIIIIHKPYVFFLLLFYRIYLIYTIYTLIYLLHFHSNINYIYLPSTKYILTISALYNKHDISAATNPSANGYYYSKYIFGIYRTISNNFR